MKVTVRLLKKLDLMSYVIVALSFIFLSCSKGLVADGESVFSKSLWVNSSSKIKIVSYYNTPYPVFLADVEANGDGSVSVPRTLLVPVKFFGTFKDPLIHVDRTKPETAIDVDMILKVYTPDSSTPDKYYEIPVLAPTLNPNNITTALSWILRWGFGNNLVKIKFSQFSELADTVAISCANCDEKTNTQVVDLILSTPHLNSKLLSFVQITNPDIAISSINYAPPDVDYAWSSSNLSRDWTIITSQKEPEPNQTTDLFVDVAFVNPSDSPSIVVPQSWAHSAELDEVPTGAVQFENVNGTPLTYSFDNFSSGLHSFQSSFSGGVSQALTVKATVTDTSLIPTCAVSGIINVRANSTMSFSVDKTITPTVTDAASNTISRLSTTEVSLDDTRNLPTSAAQRTYFIQFSVAGASITYDIEKRNDITSATALLVNNASYVSGRLINIEGYKLRISGTPLDADQVSFTVPYSSTNNPKKLIDQVGCLDSDVSLESRLRFVKSGTSPITISQQGVVSWLPSNSDLTSGTPPVSFTFFVFDDATERSQQFTISFNVFADQEPQLCTTLNASGTANADQTGCLSNFPGALPLTGLLQEGIPAGIGFTVVDLDNDPIIMTLSQVSPKPASYTSVVTTGNATRFNSIPRTEITSQITNFLWNFTPNSTQVNVDTATSATLRVKLSIRYDAARDPSLNANYVREHTFDVKVANTISPPFRAAHTVLGLCGTTSCTSTTSSQSGFNRNYYVLDANGNIASSTLINNATGTPQLISNQPFRAALVEGQVATVLLPVIASHATNTKHVYEIASPTLDCPMIQPGRVLFEEVICPGTGDTAPGCLKLRLNYSSLTETFEPLGYNLPLDCSFRIVASNPSFLEAFSDFGIFTLKVQDVQLGKPTVKPGAVAAIQLSPSMIGLNDLRVSQGQASLLPIKEDQIIDIKPFFVDVFSDIDFGARNGRNPTIDVAPLTQAPTPLAANSNLQLLTFDPSAWIDVGHKINVAVGSAVVSNTGTTGYRMSFTDDNGPISNVTSTESLQRIRISVSNDFSGTIVFENSDNASFLGTSSTAAVANFVLPQIVNYYNSTTLIAGVNSITFTAGNVSANNLNNVNITSLADPMDATRRILNVVFDNKNNIFFRVRISDYTSGDMTAHLMGTYHMFGSGSAANTTVFAFKATNAQTDIPKIRITSSSGFQGTLVFESCIPVRNTDGSVSAAPTAAPNIDPCVTTATSATPVASSNPAFGWRLVSVTDTATGQIVTSFNVNANMTRDFAYPVTGNLVRARILAIGETMNGVTLNSNPTAPTSTSCSLTGSTPRISIINLQTGANSSGSFNDPIGCATARNQRIDTLDARNLNNRLSYNASLPYFVLNGITDSRVRHARTYVVSATPTTATFNVIAHVLGTPVVSGATLPVVTVGGSTNNNNTDFARENLAFQCWFVNNPGGSETYQDCNTVVDQDNNQLFPTPAIGNLVSGTGTYFWTPPKSLAVDGNLTSNGQRIASGTILLRAFDRGFYPAPPVIPNANDCTTNSCVDHRIDLTVVETAAKPKIEILDSAQNVFLGATWKNYMGSDVTLGQTPTIEVNEGDTKTFFVRVTRYSSHQIDRYIFTLAQRSCQHGVNQCELRSVATPNATGSLNSFLIREPSNISDVHDLNTAESFTFEFKVNPNSQEGDTNNGEYDYVYRIGHNTDSSLNTDIRFRIKVRNTMP